MAQCTCGRKVERGNTVVRIDGIYHQSWCDLVKEMEKLIKNR